MEGCGEREQATEDETPDIAHQKITLMPQTTSGPDSVEDGRNKSAELRLEDPSFQSKLASLRAFRSETGHSCPANGDGVLGRWMSGLRTLYRRQQLPSEVVEVLVAEGVVFDAKEARTVREHLAPPLVPPPAPPGRPSPEADAALSRDQRHRARTKPRRFRDEMGEDNHLLLEEKRRRVRTKPRRFRDEMGEDNDGSPNREVALLDDICMSCFSTFV